MRKSAARWVWLGVVMGAMAAGCGDDDGGGGTGGTTEVCDDNADNDGDGLLDCADPSCASTTVCAAEEVCDNDGVDDDGDGDRDCNDTDCATNAACVIDGEDCTDGTDDDEDGDTDCDDTDCVGAAACEVDEVEDCTNDTDDDGDEDVDCADTDCDQDAACSSGEDEVCDNGSDDDDDELSDCRDPDCDGETECVELDCEDGLDEEDDGLADCADPDCSDEDACTDECDNFAYDDADGDIDCQDAEECSEDDLCTPEDCDQNADSDGDGAFGCNDFFCFGAAECLSEGEICGNGADDDGDDDVDCDDSEDCPCYTCGAFSEEPEGWTVREGFHAVVIADADDGLSQPVGLTFAGGDFGPLLYVSDAGAESIVAVDVITGEGTVFVGPDDWPSTSNILTAITWDAQGFFDGNLYISESVNDGDQNNIIYRVDVDGTATIFLQGPGPGLDSVYAMAFSPPTAEPAGLYLSGDTDGAYVDWGVYDGQGEPDGISFSELAGCEGMAWDLNGLYGGGLIAARPSAGGYSGDGSLTRIGSDGQAGTPLVTGRVGIHANVIGPPGPYEGRMLAADWNTQEVLSISPAGEITPVASGLELTNYDANVLAVSPDGNVLLVADRLNSRIVCLEPVPGE